MYVHHNAVATQINLAAACTKSKFFTLRNY